MRVPRRVPWANTAELEQVYHWIYTDANDYAATQRAVDRLAAWAQAVPLPHALEGTLSLLSARLLDAPFNPTQPSSSTSSNSSTSSTSFIIPHISALARRHALSAALVRFVNGLVDPLQLGAYARPIAAIAAQLGLPPWLVELRHAATHEDLPSLEVLREGVRQALAWLQDKYFVRTLYPAKASTSTSDVPPTQPTLKPLAPTLARYKAIQKRIVKDASLARASVQELAGVYREVERWIGEAKVDAVIALGALDAVGGDSIDSRERREGERHGAEESGGDEDDEAEEGTRRERWALERLAHELCERGALVPMAKKKRLQQAADRGDGSSLPELPATLVALWTPLFVQVRTRHPLLPSVLVQTIVGRLLAVPGTSPQATDNKEDVTTKIGGSYDTCLAAWATWVIRIWEPTSTPKLGSRYNSSRATAGRTAKVLLAGLGAAMVDDEPVNPAAKKLLVTLCKGHPELECGVDALEAMGDSIGMSGKRSEDDTDTDTDTDTAMLAQTKPRPGDAQIHAEIMDGGDDAADDDDDDDGEDGLKAMEERLQAVLATLGTTRSSVPGGHDKRDGDNDDELVEDDGDGDISMLDGDDDPAVSRPRDMEEDDHAPDTNITSSSVLPPGWRLLDERTGWKPAPIGVFVTCS